MAWEVDRIIPARAGFTCIRRPVAAILSGSSPLARGLLPHGYGGFPRGRIIPARAGFTPEYSHAPKPPSDHPRSRGVYPRAPTTMLMTPGSSPLARGLHMRLEKGIVADRIIPARAGFTRSVRRSSPRAMDHPRSRGVYSRAAVAIARGDGSSPLARGLQINAKYGLDVIGIIPARAGFT